MAPLDRTLPRLTNISSQISPRGKHPTPTDTMGSYTPANPDIPSLISQLTLDEKISLLAGKDFWSTHAVERVGIPSMKVSDGPNGARGGAFKDGPTSACFPAGVALAASFDRELAGRIGEALAAETRSKGASVLLGPTACPHRDPRGGRNFESYSEDPLLAGEMAAGYILGLQSAGVGASIKHFAVNEQETKRFTMDCRLSQRALREIYLKPFEIAVKKADPWTVMTSYNLVNGVHADMNEFLITKVLREEWGFKGLVMSDWGGTNSTAESLVAGHDLEMPGPPMRRTVKKVRAAVESGSLPESVIDARVAKNLELLIRADKFNHPEIPDERSNDRPEDRQLIRRAGAEAMVLLKNENKVLPLKKDNIKSIAMIGLAKEYLGHGGGSAAVNSHHKITPWQGFSEALAGSDVELRYAEGARIWRNLKPMSQNVVDDDGKPGFTVRYFDNADDSKPTIAHAAAAAVMTIERPTLDHVRLNGTFTPKSSGKHYLSFASLGWTRVTINDETVFHVEDSSIDPMAMLLGTATEERIQFDFTEGATYKVCIEAQAKGARSDLSLLANNIAAFSLGFLEKDEYEMDLHTPAIELAKESDIALVFVGNTPTWETEGCDRESMALPMDGNLDRLIAGVAKVNSSTIVINSTGSPVDMPWLDSVAGLVQTWFPGQEAGYAIADVILGVTNPSGKLPVTFPKSIEHSPSYDNFPGNVDQLQVDYKEDIFIGYRHFDRPGRQEGVLFPFGFGLSYTAFEVSDISSSVETLNQSGKFSVSARVRNTGSVSGSEVIQVYVGPSIPVESRPIKTLAGFAKARHLQAGAEQVVQIDIDADDFAVWNEGKYSWVVEAGKYTVRVGTSCREVDAKAKIEVEVKEGWSFGP
jgi:beta-glucosidase